MKIEMTETVYIPKSEVEEIIQSHICQKIGSNWSKAIVIGAGGISVRLATSQKSLG